MNIDLSKFRDQCLSVADPHLKHNISALVRPNQLDHPACYFVLWNCSKQYTYLCYRLAPSTHTRDVWNSPIWFTYQKENCSEDGSNPRYCHVCIFGLRACRACGLASPTCARMLSHFQTSSILAGFYQLNYLSRGA